MDALDKVGMGERIKRIRKKAGLRQWQLAELLGTTQSAVHKYEHGVIPEPRRLIELSRLGKTTVEWILTGRHWQNGSDKQESPTPDVFLLAERLQAFTAEDRAALDQALRIMAEAAAAVRSSEGGRVEGLDLAAKDQAVLEAARRVHGAIAGSVMDLVRERLDRGSREITTPKPAPGSKRG